MDLWDEIGACCTGGQSKTIRQVHVAVCCPVVANCPEFKYSFALAGHCGQA
jgi:hypothetical protein